MPKQVILDSLQLEGLSIFRKAGKLWVEAHYSLMAGIETYKTESRDVTASLPSAVTLNLENAWDTILAMIKTEESI